MFECSVNYFGYFYFTSPERPPTHGALQHMMADVVTSKLNHGTLRTLEHYTNINKIRERNQQLSWFYNVP